MDGESGEEKDWFWFR